MNRRVWTVSLLFVAAMASVDVVDAADLDRDDVIRRATEKGLAVLERGAKAYPSHETCFSCHHQTLFLLAMTQARTSELAVNLELIRDQASFTRASFEDRKERLAKGEHVGGRAATVGYGLWTMHLTEVFSNVANHASDLGEAMTGYLLSVQQADGRWKPPSSRPPLESSSVSCTVLSAIGIKRFASEAQKDRVAEAVARATTWLATAPLDEQEDLNFALWGEILLGGTRDRIDELANRVVHAQQTDGGWSQTPTMTSDAYATGQTLFVLMEAGIGAREACVREGIAYLLEIQKDDGSWHVVTRSKPVQPWFDNGDPHDKDQFISFSATGWATAALARSIRR